MEFTWQNFISNSVGFCGCANLIGADTRTIEKCRHINKIAYKDIGLAVKIGKLNTRK